jgi:lipoate-protein ligase A
VLSVSPNDSDLGAGADAAGSLVVFRDAFPSPPAMDTAVSATLLRWVSDGRLPEAVRIHRPGDVVAFGPMDRHEPGYAQALRAAHAHRYDAIDRLAGGRAAVFHGGTIAFSWVVPDRTPRLRIRERFERMSGAVADAFTRLGVDARVGEVPGEYCPGEFSVNARGRTKLMGVGQRLVQHAAHVGGVIVVDGADRIRAVLVDVYRELDLAWDPATVGALADEVPGITWDDAAEALLSAFACDRDLRVMTMPNELIDQAKGEIGQFAAAQRPQPGDGSGRQSSGGLTPGILSSRSGTGRGS